MNKLIRIALTFLLVMTTGGIQAEIVIYPVPQGIYYARHNDDYTVKVRQVGEKDWVDLYEYNVKVDMDTKSDATMVQFDFSVRQWCVLYLKVSNRRLMVTFYCLR